MTDIAGTVRARRVLAPNPSPMTLDGTNTWVLREPGAERSIVIDPGPAHDGHLRRVLGEAGRVAVVLLTHGHEDHAEGARRFAELAGGDGRPVPVRASEPGLRVRGAGLADGDVIDPDGLDLRVVRTPGHTRDSLSFWLPADRALLTGDTVLGRGTAVVDRLGDYLESLDRLRAMAEHADVILPGHGPRIDDPVAVLDRYIDHRHERLRQVQDAAAAGARTARQVVERVYADVDRALWPAAEWSVRAQLDHLGCVGWRSLPRGERAP